jgi:hypothetical protein
LAEEGLEKFSVYRFSINYPQVCRIEFNPKTTRQKGDVVFHFPDREKLFVSWGALRDAKKKFGTVEEQAGRSLKSASKSARTKAPEWVQHDSIEVNSHRGIYNHVRLEESSVGFISSKGRTKRDVISLHLHCEPSSRYFVIYSMPSRFAPEDFGDLFMKMVRTFQCHSTSTF